MSRAHRVRAWARRQRVPLAVLGPVLLVFLWFGTEDARADWWRVENHVAVAPGAQGWAVIGDTALRLESFERLRVLQQDLEEEFHPPPGYTLWRAEVAARSDFPEPRYCDVTVVDAHGRTFSSPALGVPGYNTSDVSCGERPDPEDLFEEPPAPGEPEPRPGQNSGEVLFLLPADADPVEVRVSTWLRDAAGFGPRYAALPVP